MARIAGVVVLLIVLYASLPFVHPNAASKSNLIDVTNRQALTGVITIGVAVLIITGAIDLSIGSVVGFRRSSHGPDVYHRHQHWWRSYWPNSSISRNADRTGNGSGHWSD